MGFGKKLETQKRFAQYRERVSAAVQEKKIFKIMGGGDGATRIREVMRRRGWIEQKVIAWYAIYNQMSKISLVNESKPGNEAEYALIYKLLGDYTPDFVWANNYLAYDLYRGFGLMNRVRFTGLNFCGKDEIVRYVEQINSKIGDPEKKVRFSRTFEINDEKDVEMFKKQFELNLVTGLILYLFDGRPIHKFFVKLSDSTGHEGLDFALRLIESCSKLSKNHEKFKIFDLFCECDKLNAVQWNQIFAAHEAIVKKGKRIRLDGAAVKEYITRIQLCGTFLKACSPDTFYEGYHNIYILKPAWSGEADGVTLMDNREQILALLQQANRKFIIQKYIERPLLLYGHTKTDIRQYFLISLDRRHYRGWSHPLCSIKLCSKQFSLTDFHESCHITNTSVQSKYHEKTDPDAPDHHMMSLASLNQYFEKIGKKDVYWEVIYPEMKRVLQAFVETSYDHIEHRPGRYQLFGCDWMITEDYKVYLIEINATPSLEHYTPVSNVLIDTVLEDLVKVTVDFQRDPTAYTGAFEIVHEMPLYKSSAEYQNIQQQQQNNGELEEQQEKVKREVAATYNSCSVGMTANQVPSENNIEVPAAAAFVKVVA
ncbi:tubulin glycylase 3B-like [Culicoides brevitarsis]|uniref:tubulin glycylase 3B-like n=1 Tax=Culicoides brevitarsis TaxID=469753 RepID=UPI00307BACBA